MPLSLPVDVNLNSMVTVTLTRYGVRVLRNAASRHEIVVDTTLIQPTDGETPWVDDAQTVPAWMAPLTLRMELWRLMALFGRSMRKGAPAPFLDNRVCITPIQGLERTHPASTGLVSTDT